MASPPPTHQLHKTTSDKLCQVLDSAEASGAAVVKIQFMGGRDWVVITHGSLLGPAMRRVASPHEE